MAVRLKVSIGVINGNGSWFGIVFCHLANGSDLNVSQLKIAENYYY